MSEVYHIPVLLKETVDGLDIKSNGTYVDLTFGGGGHSREILSRLGKGGHLYSFDQDLDAQQNAQPLEETYGETFTFVRSNFRFLKNWMQYYGVEHVDGILADLGVSSHHLDDGERGFSFRYDAKLDMRMNQAAKLKASDVLKNYSEEQLANVRRTEEQQEAGFNHRKSKGYGRDGDNRPVGRSAEALSGLRSREERPGSRVPGLADRSKRRDGCTKANAGSSR